MKKYTVHLTKALHVKLNDKDSIDCLIQELVADAMELVGVLVGNFIRFGPSGTDSRDRSNRATRGIERMWQAGNFEGEVFRRGMNACHRLGIVIALNSHSEDDLIVYFIFFDRGKTKPFGYYKFSVTQEGSSDSGHGDGHPDIKQNEYVGA